MTIHGMFANGGWMLYFDVPEKHIREISYRMDAGAAFTSTGESSTQTDSLTGLPVPSSTITVPGLRGPHIIEVKYTDSQGQSHGPFSIPFDPQTEVIKQTKDILRLIGSWVSFREFSGKMLVYFTPVVSYKNAFRDIVYSVDNESVSQHLKFKPDWSGIGAPGLGPDDQTYLEIPMSTKYVAVKLIYADGTESAVRRFNIAQSEVER